MKPLIAGLHGAAFAGALSVLIFFLKVICPLATGCFVDPFLVILFAPLKLFDFLHVSDFISYGNEPYAILLFWIMIGFVLGFLISLFFTKEKPSTEAKSAHN